MKPNITQQMERLETGNFIEDEWIELISFTGMDIMHRLHKVAKFTDSVGG